MKISFIFLQEKNKHIDELHNILFDEINKIDQYLLIELNNKLENKLDNELKTELDFEIQEELNN